MRGQAGDSDKKQQRPRASLWGLRWRVEYADILGPSWSEQRLGFRHRCIGEQGDLALRVGIADVVATTGCAPSLLCELTWSRARWKLFVMVTLLEVARLNLRLPWHWFFNAVEILSSRTFRTNN